MSLRTVNYYPAATPGPAMWQPATFSPATISRDMLVARGLGFQALRIFLPISGAKGADTFDLPEPTGPQLDRLRTVCTLAKQTGLKLHLTLFDMWGSHGWQDQSKTWATAIAGAVDHSVLTVVELANELPYASTAPYVGGGPQALPTIGQTVTAWAKAMIPVLRGLFPGLPISVSCNGLPDTHLAAARKALGSLPTFYDWHVYPSTCPDPETLIRAQQLMKPRALRVGEYGCPSVTADGKASEAGQAGWMGAALAACKTLGIIPAPWCLYDYAAIWTGQAASYGLLAADGRIKPAGALYLDWLRCSSRVLWDSERHAAE